jgi:hypothetical protein
MQPFTINLIEEESPERSEDLERKAGTNIDSTTGIAFQNMYMETQNLVSLRLMCRYVVNKKPNLQSSNR